LILWIIIYLKVFFPLDKISIARQNLLLPSALFLLSSTVVVISLSSRKKTILFLLVFLVSFDLFRFSSKWQSFDSKNLVFLNTPVINKLLQINKSDRILGNFGAEVTNFYKLGSIEGYDPIYQRRYGQFMASLESGNLSDSPRSVVSFPNDSFFASQAANLLNIKYIVHKISDGRSSWTFPFWKFPKQFELIYKDQKYATCGEKRIIKAS